MIGISCRGVTFSPIEAVIFDKDGTLAAAENYLRSLAIRRSRLIDAQVPGVQEPLNLAFGIEGEGLAAGGLMAVGSRQENEIAAAAYVAETGRGWIEALELVRAAFIEADQYLRPKAPQTPLMAGAVELLQVLHQANIKIALLSADSTTGVQEFISYYQLGSYISIGLGADGYLSKTEPRLLQNLLNKLDTPADRILVIGDALSDIEVAHGLGAAGCIGVIGGWQRSLQLKQASVVTKSLTEIHIQAI
ncbi:HAD family hydrolase [Phormidium tenue FACHB-886]|nr:HAD family hydrolase [Phormidium tenue FACHB-886]